MKLRTFALAIGLLLFVPPPLWAQDDDDHTPAALVLSMSVTQWDAFYAHHHGGEENEVTERASLRIYADDLRVRNGTALRRLLAKRATRLRGYQTLIGTLHADALGLSSDNNGGGTMYEEIYDDAAVRDGLLLWARVTSPAPLLTSTERADVRANLAALRRALRRMRPTDAIGPGQFPRDMAALRRDAGQLDAAVSADPTHDALAVSRYVATEVVPDMTPQ